MDLDFLSGLLLTLAVVAILVYLIRALLPGGFGELRKVPHNVGDTLTRYVGSQTKPVNAHLVGAVGTVVAHSGEPTRPMKIRLGLELWPARLSSGAEDPLPLGTRVGVVSVDGPVMIVAPSVEDLPQRDLSGAD